MHLMSAVMCRRCRLPMKNLCCCSELRSICCCQGSVGEVLGLLTLWTSALTIEAYGVSAFCVAVFPISMTLAMCWMEPKEVLFERMISWPV